MTPDSSSSWIIGLFGAVTVFGLLYVAIALGLLKKKRRSLEPHQWVPIPLSTMNALVPCSWKVSALEHQLLLKSGKKDGVLLIQKLPNTALHVPLKTFVNQQFEDLDFAQNTDQEPWESIEASGRDPKNDERVYLQFHRIKGPQESFLIQYRSSILYGMVDGYQVHAIVSSIYHKCQETPPQAHHQPTI